MAARRRFTKPEPATTSPSPRLHMPCWLRLWVVLLTLLLSPSHACSAKYTGISEEGKCRYDLTSIATLSCVRPDGVWRPPSDTCCSALLYAIDQVPGSDVSGACCLCRYLKERAGPPKLATTYIMCNGEDKHIVTKWSSFPIKKCLDECGQATISSLGIEHEDTPGVQTQGIINEGKEHVSGIGQTHATTKVIWVAVVVFIVISIWLIFFSNFRRSFKATENASEPRSGRRRSVGSSSSAKRKEKRLSSST